MATEPTRLLSDQGVDLEAEQAVLGAILITDRVLPTLIIDEGLAPDHFHRPTHQRIYRAMLALHDQGAGIDPITVARKAGINQTLVEQFAATVPAAGNARHYATIVKRASQRRRWQHAAALLQEAAATDSDTHAAQAETLLAAPTVTDDTWTTDRLADEVIAYFDKSPAGITTGFRQLDKILGGGLRPGDMTVLGGWENIGKTPLLHQWLAHAAGEGRRVHAYINEMSPQDVALRMIAHKGVAPWSRISERTLTDREAAAVMDANRDLPFEVTVMSDWTAEQVARHMRINRWDLCGLDVLHNMPYRDERELSQIVATLTNAARSSGTHLVIVAHLNQERAKTELLPRPVRRDLRGTGMLAKAATSVVFLHRDQELVDGFVHTSKLATIVADKAKHGRSGDGIEAVFEFEHMRFRLPTSLELQSGVAA